MISPHLTHGRHYVEVNGITLSYEVRGEGPLLVWHPGGPGMSIQGYPGYEVLTKSFTVVYLDPRGVGKSEQPVQIPDSLRVNNFDELEIPNADVYALERYSDDLLALQNLWGLDKMSLAGHSHGGFVVFDYITRYPDKVDKAVIVGSAGVMAAEDQAYEARRKSKTETDAYRKYLAMFQEQEKYGLTPLNWYKYGLMLQLTIDVHDFEKHEERLFDAIMNGSDTDLSFVPAYYFGTKDAARYDMRSRYKDIKASVLFLQGRQELLFFPEDVEEAANQIPDAQVAWIEDCAHMLMTEQPEAFMDALEKFLISRP